MVNKTGIVAMLGPASDSLDTMRELLAAKLYKKELFRHIRAGKDL